MSLILVVEDNDHLRKAIVAILELGGYQVAFATSDKEAVRLCQERAMDLVITDLGIPEMDGLELIRSLRQTHSNLPVIATSGASNNLLKEATELGAVGTLEKPFTDSELLAMIDNTLGKGMENKVDDVKTLTIICPKCRSVISYVTQGAIAYAGTCPNCKTGIPELRGAMIVAFERPEKEE